MEGKIMDGGWAWKIQICDRSVTRAIFISNQVLDDSAAGMSDVTLIISSQKCPETHASTSHNHNVSPILQFAPKRTTEPPRDHFRIEKVNRGLVIEGCRGPSWFLSRLWVPQPLEPLVSRKFPPHVPCVEVGCFKYFGGV